MTMKRYFKSLVVLTVLASAAACQYEPKIVSGEPSVVLDAEHIETVQGETVTVTGTATDPAGIRSITLKADTWGYTREIDLSPYIPSQYVFSAEVPIPESAAVGSGNFSVTVLSAVSGTATASCAIDVDKKPEPVLDAAPPVITLDSPVTAKVGEPYEFSLTFSDDVGIIECWPKLHITKGWSDYPTVNGEAYDMGGYSLTVSGASTTFTYTLLFPSGGTYDVIVYDSDNGVSDGVHTLDRADDWSIAKFTIDVEFPESSDKEAPTITMNSPSTAVFGEPYTLSLTFADEGGMGQAWPLVKVYCGDVYPKELAENWNGWWPEVSGTSVTVEQVLTFTQAGEYKVWIDPVTDLSGNSSEGKEWFTINVTEGSVPPPADPISVKMTSAGTASVGVPYTVEIQFEAAAGFVENWPKISLWGDFDPWPTLISQDWFTLSGGSTSYTYTKEVTFTTPGSYVLGVYADADFFDADGHTLPQGLTFRIDVSE